MTNNLMTSREVAARLGVTRRTVYNYMERGLIKTSTDKHHLWFSAEDVEKLAQAIDERDQALRTQLHDHAVENWS